jgi:hypothetical protein
MHKIRTLATGAITVAGAAGVGGVAQAAPLAHAPAHNGGPATHSIKTFKTRSGSVRPDSAFGCNQDVCISIAGNGRYINYWATAAFTTYKNRCTEPAFWSAGHIIFYGSQQCRASSFYGYTSYISGSWWRGNVQVCNTWTGIPGKPCETIK